MFIINITMNQSGSDKIRREISQVMEQKIDYIVLTIENEFDRIFQVQKVFLGDPDIQDLSIRPDTLSKYEKTKAINDLRLKLYNLASSSKYIKDAFVIMPNTKKRLSYVSGFEDADEEEYRILKESPGIYTNYVYLNNQFFIPLGYPISSRTQYLLVVEISLESIRNDLDIFNKDTNSITYLIDKGNGIVLTSKSAESTILPLIEKGKSTNGQRINFNGKNYLSFEKEFSNFQWNLTTLLVENDILGPVYSFKKWYWPISFISIIVIISASFLIYRVIHQPLQKLQRAFGSVDEGKMEISITISANDEFKYIYEKFNHMVVNLKELVRQVYEEKLCNQKFELKQLQSQINPHFLYNSLYILYRMAQDEDYNGITVLSKHLGDYYKFITQNKAEFISLGNEMKHAEVYAAIQHIRFGNRIQFNFNSTGFVSQWEVPRLIIQPLVENAVNHGLKDIYRDGVINTNIIAEEERLVIEVEDNGCGMTEEQLVEWESRIEISCRIADHHALWNVHRRLELCFGQGSGVHLSNNALGGLTVRLDIKGGHRNE